MGAFLKHQVRPCRKGGLRGGNRHARLGPAPIGDTGVKRSVRGVDIVKTALTGDPVAADIHALDGFREGGIQHLHISYERSKSSPPGLRRQTSTRGAR